MLFRSFPVLCLNRPLSIPHQAFIVGIVPQPCHNMGLSDDQKQICMSEANRELLPTIRYGASLAYKQCQYQFKYRRWNCSVPEKDSNSLFRRITGKGKYLVTALTLVLYHVLTSALIVCVRIVITLTAISYSFV